MLNAEDWDGLVALARSQVKEGAHVLDVNVDYVGRDGERDMHELVSRLVTNVTLPLMLDSTEWQKMEAGLKVAGGKCILNSTNYEDGDERFFKVLELAKSTGRASWWAPSTKTAWPARLRKSSRLPSGPIAMLWSTAFPPTSCFSTPWPCPSPPGLKKTG
jgi:cobalamin-dependent methionine synthase I